MLDVQREARALGDPTRFRLFRYIVDSAAPVGVAELTGYLALNHNAIRQHLAVLKDAEMVVEEIEQRHRAGRPRLLYSPHPEATGRWGTPGPYAWLASLLSGALRDGLDPRQAGYREGRRRVDELGDVGDHTALLEDEMSRQGFRPVRVERGKRVDFVLGRCPFADVAARDPETICQLHLGLAEGLGEGPGDLTVDKLVARNPHKAGCRLIVQRSRASAPTRI